MPPLTRKLAPNYHFRSKSGFRRWRDCASAAGFVPATVRWYVPYRLRKFRRILGNGLASVLVGPVYVLVMAKPLGEDVGDRLPSESAGPAPADDGVANPVAGTVADPAAGPTPTPPAR